MSKYLTTQSCFCSEIPQIPKVRSLKCWVEDSGDSSMAFRLFSIGGYTLEMTLLRPSPAILEWNSAFVTFDLENENEDQKRYHSHLVQYSLSTCQHLPFGAIFLVNMSTLAIWCNIPCQHVNTCHLMQYSLSTCQHLPFGAIFLVNMSTHSLS